MLGWNESIEVVGTITNVADVPRKRNIVWRKSSSHQSRHTRTRRTLLRTTKTI